MSRIIKFRAKVLNVPDLEGEWATTDEAGYVNFFHMLAENDIDEKTLGQYTGIKDKNGKEIYEGDILEMDGREDSRSEVIYDDKKWARFLAHGKENVSIYMPFVENGTNLWRIIGNVYESPELM